MKTLLFGSSGQSSVEAAFLIPVLFGAILLLVQPGIVLYDRMVMRSAAMEGCRVLATLPEGDSSGQCEAFVRRRLSAVPQQDCFHVHGGDCSWEIQLEGGESSSEVTITIKNRIKPLPLLSWGSAILGASGPDGAWVIEVTHSMETQPGWARASARGDGPSTWIGKWLQ